MNPNWLLVTFIFNWYEIQLLLPQIWHFSAYIIRHNELLVWQKDNLLNILST